MQLAALGAGVPGEDEEAEGGPAAEDSYGAGEHVIRPEEDGAGAEHGALEGQCVAEDEGRVEELERSEARADYEVEEHEEALSAGSAGGAEGAVECKDYCAEGDHGKPDEAPHAEAVGGVDGGAEGAEQGGGPEGERGRHGNEAGEVREDLVVAADAGAFPGEMDRPDDVHGDHGDDPVVNEACGARAESASAPERGYQMVALMR